MIRPISKGMASHPFTTGSGKVCQACPAWQQNWQIFNSKMNRGTLTQLWPMYPRQSSTLNTEAQATVWRKRKDLISLKSERSIWARPLFCQSRATFWTSAIQRGNLDVRYLTTSWARVSLKKESVNREVLNFQSLTSCTPLTHYHPKVSMLTLVPIEGKAKSR